MFEPIDTPLTTNSFKKPASWDENLGECISLPVAVVSHDGFAEFISWWKVSLKDRLRILFGRPIRLTVMSNNQPPVCVDCEKGTK